MASPAFGCVTAGVTLATIAAILGAVLPRFLSGGSPVLRAIEDGSIPLGMAAWFVGVVYRLALLDPDIGLREALRSRQRFLVVGSIMVICAYVATVTVVAVGLLTSHGM